MKLYLGGVTRLRVEGSRQDYGVSTGFLGPKGLVNYAGRGHVDGSGKNRDLPAGRDDSNFDHTVPLGIGQVRHFAGGAQHEEAAHTGLQKELHVAFKGRRVHLPVAIERRAYRRDNAAEPMGADLGTISGKSLLG
jgi:hypothetical protein